MPVRPTTDFAKEALFNVLNNRYEYSEIKVLDLFAGSGNISYEFVSRGVKDICSVDQDASCIKFINKISTELGANIRCIHAEVSKYLGRQSHSFDVIFMDPPYDYANYRAIIQVIIQKKLIKENGLLVVEHDRSQNFEDMPAFSEMRKYGKVHFSFFQYI